METDAAAELDAALPDRDWTVLADGTVKSWFTAPSGRLATISLGDPSHPRVLLVPGVTGSKEDFILMMPGLVAAGYYVQSVDMAGQYESTDAGPENLAPPRAHYDYDLFVDDLLAMLDDGSGPSHVLGYSFAGTVSQLAFLRRPDLFRSLTLLSCPPEPGQGFRGVKRIGPFTGLATGRAGAFFMIWGLGRNVTHVPPGRQAFVEHRLTITRRASVRDIISLMKRAPDARAELRASAIPKLVAVGEHDLWPLALHARFAEQIQARVAVYRTGHSPCETTPNQLVRDMLELFDRA
ncbi:MAG: alpha/beta hydrolase [Microbacteriaceae bacterium]|nr:alpha/beta hydrolase [Microbacteriaceae bacterium]